MSDAIQGKGPELPPLNSKDKAMYEAEYKHSADLFKRALDEYAKSDNRYQKNEFKGVMQKALHIMGETASELRRKDLKAQNDQIGKDFLSFQTNDNDTKIQAKLNSDLERAKRSIG